MTPDSGEIIYDGKNLATLKRREWQPLRKDIQMIFQNPHKAFNPRFSVYECCAEPIRLFGNPRHEFTQSLLAAAL